jgi:hypothetical protein
MFRGGFLWSDGAVGAAVRVSLPRDSGPQRGAESGLLLWTKGGSGEGPLPAVPYLPHPLPHLRMGLEV